MPTYIYLCEKHGEFEYNHSMESSLEECPQCKDNNEITPVKRLIASANFILKGSCWAKDKYG